MESDMSDDPVTYYCVVRIADSKRLCLTRWLRTAADRLNPGTCHGSGPTKEAAEQNALEQATIFREQAERENE
jgi:hypothetical protein